MSRKNVYIILIIVILLISVLLGFYYFKTSSGKLSISTAGGQVKINDVYKNPVQIFPDSDVSYKKTADYSLDYYAKDQLFIITLTNPDIKTARINAENDFLYTLKITKEQACKLTVQLGVPFSVNEAYAGINFGLSFCPNGKPF